MRCPSKDAERFAPRGSKRNVNVRSVGDVRDEASVVAMIGKSECNMRVFSSSLPERGFKGKAKWLRSPGDGGKNGSVWSSFGSLRDYVRERFCCIQFGLEAEGV